MVRFKVEHVFDLRGKNIMLLISMKLNFKIEVLKFAIMW